MSNLEFMVKKIMLIRPQWNMCAQFSISAMLQQDIFIILVVNNKHENTHTHTQQRQHFILVPQPVWDLGFNTHTMISRTRARI